MNKGFGLPALEAMACGIPIIASKAGALPEVVANAAVLIDPLDPGEIKTAIEMLLEDKQMQSDLVSRGKRRAQQFSWKKAAQETREVLEWAASNG